MLFVDAVKAASAQLTPSQKQLARHILDHSEQIAFATAKQVGDAAGVSDAAVVRFARALGYDGFPAMRMALRDGLLERVGSVGMRSIGHPTSSGEDLRRAVFANDAALIEATEQLNSTALAETVVDLMSRARRIWIVGHGTTYPLALMLSMQLNQAFGNADVLNVGNGDLADRLRHVGKGDVLIGIGYARYLPYTLDVMRIGGRFGAHVIAITDKPSSPLAELAQHTFVVGRSGAAIAWWSQAGTLALVNWLVEIALHRNGPAVTEWLRRSDEVWRELGHWNSDGNSPDDRSLVDHLKAQESAAQAFASQSTKEHSNEGSEVQVGRRKRR
ncbi:MurR/RpiR family transcriptional regulator [Chitinasiproducens palmae]|uniref:DNA-binding transcriptional regulator, MurR/RpiR family, contains HTH and SIS domains n=1 Tax=Chitinasiproducens palmae TaxID=1770053 RepID=A0A1H2PK29_9BURK|nr:MurR/RpiR family transcriptional regulator [Chitinasiproducens palmae]SDV46739.1 DNA-binding transcriptional regulator, MurR/RpiR family, contains HTH and SIS domains [Chitinasiproducens palmae]